MQKNLLMLIVSVAALAQSSIASGHDGLSKQVEDVTHALEARGAPSELLLRRADLHRVEGRYEEALADLRAASSTDLAPTRVLNLRGLVELEQGKTGVAEATLTRSVEASDNFFGRWYRARARVALGSIDDALTDYDRAIAIRSVTDVFLERGRLLEARGEWSDAVENYELALDRLGEVGVVRERLFEAELATGSTDAAIRAVEPMINRLPVRTRWLVMRARAHIIAGDHAAAMRDKAAALRDVEKALEKRRSPLLLIERARVHAAFGEDAVALTDVEEALRRAPHYEPARKMKASLGLRGAP